MYNKIMENKNALLLNPLKKGSWLRFLKLIKHYRYVIASAALLPFIIYYFIIVTDDLDFMSSYNPKFKRRPLLSIMEPVFNTTDFHKLIDLNDFNFTIRPPVCPDGGVDLLVLVYSGPHNFLQRQVIRRTWASQEQNSKFGNFRVFFLLGIPDSLIKQGELILEGYQFEDIIQGSVIDHYRNLTYKHVMGLKWHKYFCRGTKVVLKCDDDVIINTPYILQSFETNFWETFQDANQDFIIGHVFIGTQFHRDDSKWYVSKEVWKDDTIPPYVGGFAMFFAGPTAVKLHDESPNVPYLFVEDAFISGFVRQRIGVNLTDLHILLNTSVQQIINLKNATHIEIENFFVGPFDIDILELGEPIWNGLLSFVNHSRKRL